MDRVVRRLGTLVLAGVAVGVAFPAGAFTVSNVLVEVRAGPKPATLTATLHRPQGAGPLATLVFLHGCGGLSRRQRVWADELSGDGYAVLVLDSFSARGVKRVCGDGAAFPGEARATDAFAAVRYLREIAWVDRERIAVVGWSHGGWAALWALVRQREHPAERLRAAIAFYPACTDNPGWRGGPPLLMLLGAQDNWTSAARCALLAEQMRLAGQPVEAVTYPGAEHAFDDAGLRGVVTVPDARRGRGATMAYDPAAHADARARVRGFLTRVMR